MSVHSFRNSPVNLIGRRQQLPISTSLILFAVLPVFFQAGCGKQRFALKIPTEVDMPVLLVSEILAAKDRTQLGKCPIEIVNPSSESREVRLVRTGCACYGVALDGKRIANGEVITVPAGKTAHAEIEFQPAESQSEKSYTADLSVQLPEGQTQTVSVKCRLKVMTDVRITPNIITVDAIPDQVATASSMINIEHCYRSETGKSKPPEFSELPPEMTVLEILPNGEPQRISQDLWRQNWQAKVQQEFPADRPASLPASQNYHVVFNDPQGETSTGRGTVVLHSRQKVIFPNRVHFGKVPVGSTRTRRIFLTNTEDGLFRVRVNSTELPPQINVSLAEHSDQRHLLELSFTPDRPGPFSEMVTLQTDMYNVSEIGIRVEGVAEMPKPKVQDGQPNAAEAAEPDVKAADEPASEKPETPVPEEEAPANQ